MLSYERELSVGETIIWSTRARSSSSTHHLLPFGEWCLLDWLGVTWEPPSRLWSWTKKFVRVRRFLLPEDLSKWGKSFVGNGHGGIDKVASSWTLRGWALRGLEQPLPFVGWSLHQRGCTIAPPIGTTPKISVSPIAFHTPITSLYFLATCMLYFPLLIYSCHACLKCIVNV